MTMDSPEPSSPSILETADTDTTQHVEPANFAEIPSIQHDEPASNHDTPPSPNTLSIPEQDSSTSNNNNNDSTNDSNPNPDTASNPNSNSEPTPSQDSPNQDTTTTTTTTTAPPHRQSKPRKPQLTRDQRRSILLMRSLGYTYLRIAQHLGITVRGVQYTCEQRSASPKPRPGRTRILTDDKMEEIESFITRSLENRMLNYAGLIEKLGLDVKEDTLVQSLRRRGWTRQMAFLRSELASVSGSGSGSGVRGENDGTGGGGTKVTAKPVRTWLTCREDEELEESCERVLEVVRSGKKRKRAK